MTFKLRILFDGLCVFVPNTEESKGMRVLVIDGRAPGVASNGEGHVSHIPSLRFTLADLAPDRQQPAYQIDYSSVDPTPRGSWLLNGDDLEIRVDGKPLPDGPLTILRSESEPLRDFSLVPSMQSIYPDIGGLEVKRECLDKDLRRLADAGLVARLRLQNGTVGAWDGADGRFISTDEYMFLGTPGLHRQRIAGCAFFETEVEGGTVEIVSRQRGKGPVFRPHDGCTLEIKLRNDPPEDLMGARPTHPEADYDFELVYQVAKNSPPQMRVPVVAASVWADAVERAGSESAPSAEAGRPVHCPTASYNPSAEADPPSQCMPVAYNPSTEAGGPGAIQCMGASFNPTHDAGMATVHCTGAIFNPSSEAGSRTVECMGAIYNPSQEAGGTNRPICTGGVFNPSQEASGFNGPICSGGVFNPSHEAAASNRPICTGVVFNPSRTV